MSTIYVKPAPDLSPAAVKALRSETGVGLIDAAGNVPEGGMPWPNGGLTFRLLTDGAILRADDPIFDVKNDVEPKDESEPEDKPEPKSEPDPAPALPKPLGPPLAVATALRSPAPQPAADASSAH